MKYTSINTIFAKIRRDLKGTSLAEDDIIEWAGEALEYIRSPKVMQENVAFKTVKNFECELPKNTEAILQIAKYNNYTTENTDVEEDEYYLNLTYNVWATSSTRMKYFTPVRLTENTFFNSIVCKEKDMTMYQSCTDEYTIIGTTNRLLRFNFQEGQVAVSYVSRALDEDGLPMIPDNISVITAITYYIKWKIAEWYAWNGREGFDTKAEKAQERWEHYVSQSNSFFKMPGSIDEYQNLLEQSHNLLPNVNTYYRFFKDSGMNREGILQNLKIQ